MSQANEFRIGNLVKHPHADAWMKVLEIGQTCVSIGVYKIEDVLRPEDIAPIPITAKILEKCGFEKGSNIFDLPNEFFISYNAAGLYLQVEKEKEFKSDYVCERLLLPHIKYLHQLQNLVFLLTGKELEYKP